MSGRDLGPAETRLARPMSDWKIRRKHEGCSRCQRAFAEGEAHFSVLLLAAELLEREDLCGACFQDRRRDPEAEELIWWRTRRPADRRRGLAVDFDTVEQLFHGLEPRPETRLQELRYLLCLLLMRKRRLKLARVVREAGGEVLRLRRPRRQEEIAVRVFDLGAERLAELRADLEGLFEGASAEDLLAEGAAGADPAAPAPGSAGGEGPAPTGAGPEAPPEGTLPDPAPAPATAGSDDDGAR